MNHYSSVGRNHHTTSNNASGGDMGQSGERGSKEEDCSGQ
jgi:hypothetical protein